MYFKRLVCVNTDSCVWQCLYYFVIFRPRLICAGLTIYVRVDNKALLRVAWDKNKNVCQMPQKSKHKCKSLSKNWWKACNSFQSTEDRPAGQLEWLKPQEWQWSGIEPKSLWNFWFFLSKMVLHEWCVSMSRRNPLSAALHFPSGFYVYGQAAFLTLHWNQSWY